MRVKRIFEIIKRDEILHLDESEAETLLKELIEEVGPPHIGAEGDKQGHKFCLLSYCSVRDMWARSCDNYMSVVSTGSQVRLSTKCSKCGLQTVIKVHDLRANRFILQ